MKLLPWFEAVPLDCVFRRGFGAYVFKSLSLRDQSTDQLVQ